MSLITQIFAGPPSSDRGGDGSMSFTDGGGGLQPGGSVAAQALVNSTVYRCASLIGGTCAALPPRIIARGDKTRTEVRRDEHQHIYGRPNPVSRRITLWETAYVAALTSGDAHLWKGRRANSGRVAELWFLPPSRVRTGLASDNTKVFELDRDPRKGYTDREILHVPAMSADGVKGFPPLDAITRPFNIINAAAKYGQRFLEKGSTVGGILTTDQVLDQAQADAIKERWRAQQAGLINSHDIVVLGHGAAYKPVAVTQEEAQYIETLEHWELRIAQAYGIPPHMLGIVDKSTSWGSGIEQQVIGFVTFTLLNWLIRFEQAIQDELLTPDLEMKFVLNGLLRGDTVQRFASYRTGITSGIYSPDEAREFEDLGPRPDGKGGVYVDPTAANTGLRNGGGASGPESRPRAQLQLLPNERPYLTSDADDFTQAIATVLREQHYAERVEQKLDTLVAEGRCPKCEKLLARNVNVGAELHCSRCKTNVPVAA